MTVQYQGVWTLQSAAQLQSTQRWVTDPLYKNTTLLLQADDAANAAQNNTFLDSSSNNFTITRNGNTTQGSFTPFSQAPGRWGNYFDGSGDYLQLSSNAAFSFGTSDFTIEAWFYSATLPTLAAGGDGIFTAIGSVGLYVGSDGVRITQSGTAVLNDVSTAIATNTWYHLALTRTGTSMRVFLNGTQVGATLTNSTNFSNTGNVRIGTETNQDFDGYISNLRVLKGTAQYTANFTPSLLPLTAIANTSLLTCQSNRFVDNSSNNFSFTISGTPSVQAFSPFAPQYQWTSSVIGGSGYFDGTGDYLVSPTSSNLSLASNTSDFSFECWVYNNGFSGSQFGRGIFIYYPSGSYASTRLMLRLSPSSNKINIYLIQSTFTQFGGGGTDSTGVCTPSAWTHVAFIRNSNTFYLYLNGVLDTTLTASFQPQDLAFSTYSVIEVGRTQDGSTPDFNGYISGFRFVRNSAVYTTNFTLPTTPPTAITNTALLLNFTNAAIYDGTMKNNLETVGNAQISTAVVKYGSGSMYFDGTGDYLRSAPSPICALGSGDFTIEFWANIPSYSSNRILSWGTTSAPIIYFASGFLYYDVYGGANIAQSTIITPLNTWTHCAVVRLNGVTRLYINGVQGGSATDTNNWTGQSGFWVGTDAGTTFYTGYLDDLRITKGIARYTQNFIPPSVALPRQ